ncbi:MAG: hypothetical protein H6683_02895 [Deltaproteobacteria bacterium]|nr:hypothetical protein [Deltaproteobacteria bacterium]MCB9478603.1 hypothetical protein [Deltaproteobacteria bacterium]
MSRRTKTAIFLAFAALMLAVGVACVSPEGSPTAGSNPGAAGTAAPGSPGVAAPEQGAPPPPTGETATGPAPGIPEDGPGPAPGIPDADPSGLNAAPPLPGQAPMNPAPMHEEAPPEGGADNYKVKDPAHGEECFAFCARLCPAAIKCEIINDMKPAECVTECRKFCAEDKISLAYDKCLKMRCKKMKECTVEVDEEQRIELPYMVDDTESNAAPTAEGTTPPAPSPSPSPSDKPADE